MHVNYPKPNFVSSEFHLTCFKLKKEKPRCLFYYTFILRHDWDLTQLKRI